MNVNFEYELPSGQTVLIEAEVTPFTPTRYPDRNGPGEPAEGGDVEILSTRLVCNEDDDRYVEVDLTGLFFRRWKSTKFETVISDIKVAAADYAERMAA
jgi:hypothetical protein